MSDLLSLVATALGVPQEGASPTLSAHYTGSKKTKKAKKPEKVEPRPEPIFEYHVTITLPLEQVVTVYAENEDEAVLAADALAPSLDWSDASEAVAGEWQIENPELADSWGEASNQAEIDDWESVYGECYDEDGDPMCSGCASYVSADELTDSDDLWYCEDCLDLY